VRELFLVVKASNFISNYHLLHLVVNLRNIHVEPNHDRSCGGLNNPLCKQSTLQTNLLFREEVA